MGYKVVIGKSAKADLQNILDWYTGESLSALQKFVGALYERLDDLVERPESFGVVRQHQRFRKVKISRFPYFIVFRIDETRNKVFISAVIHVKRNPEIWIKRLR